jgi:RHS repeat-associated protein
MVQQFIHGTQYIDELVLVRVKDKGEMFVHQDANWNVIGTTDMGRRVLEHNVLSPYGQLAVNQETGFGDRDGDSDVDSTDKGTVGVTCTGTVSGSCRILDLDFDGDYDSSDATLCDALPQGWQGREGLIASAVGQPFAHQGLLFEPEIGSYQNRARQFSSTLSQYLSRDPLSSAPLAGSGYGDGLSLYLPLRGNPCARLDSSGEASVTNLPWQILVRSRIVFWGPAADNPPGQWRTVLSGMRNILNQLRVPRRGRLAVIDPETGTPKPMVFTLSGDYWDDASGTCNNLPNHDDFEGSYPVGSTLGSCAGNAENYMQGDAAMGLHPFPYVSGTGRVILGRAQFCFGEDHAWAIPEGDVAAHEFGHNLCARHCNGPGHGSDSGPHLMRSSGGWFMPCHTLSEIAPGHMIPWTTECVNLGSLGLPPMSQVQH